jgi:hypothetical protein
MKALTGRAPMKSPGKPSLRRDVERLFWREIAKGLASEEAAIAVGASQAAGSRWFRERGGMPTFMLATHDAARVLGYPAAQIREMTRHILRRSKSPSLQVAAVTARRLRA